MGKTYSSIDSQLADFINQQQMFFVATAPSEDDGHLNLSPKGLDSFRILDEHRVAYLDLIGSGIETVAHLQQNQRIVLMFCAFDGPPKIVRLYGRGEVIRPQHPEFATLQSLFPDHLGVRSVIRVTCQRIADSCGFGVPLYEFQGHRHQLAQWAQAKSADDLEAYIDRMNRHSIDGLPGLSSETTD